MLWRSNGVNMIEEVLNETLLKYFNFHPDEKFDTVTELLETAFKSLPREDHKYYKDEVYNLLIQYLDYQGSKW